MSAETADTSEDICGANAENDDRVPWDICRNPPGWGTEHQGTGLCTMHEEDEEYLPNFQLFSPNHLYYQQQNAGEREKLEKIAYDIVQRFQRTQGTIDEFDKEIARQLAVDMHLVRRSADHVAGPLIHGATPDDQEVNKMLHQHRRLQESIIDRAKKAGIMMDPESKKAQAEEDKADAWREFVEGDFE